MKPKRPALPKEDSLAELVRSSSALDANLKRYWLSVLSHLSEADRERLRSILTPGSVPQR